MTARSLDQTVTTIAAEIPGEGELFRRTKFNLCGSGDVTLIIAAAKAGLELVVLHAELEAVQRAAGRAAPDETGMLIDHLLARYHETHRTELEFRIPLAQKVERVHGDHPGAPNGLSQTSTAIRDDLDSQMMKEGQVLFPMMRRGGDPLIEQMRHEHDNATQLLKMIEAVTHGPTLPPGACGSWTALYTGVKKFPDDLMTHMHLENAVLCARFQAAARKRNCQ